MDGSAEAVRLAQPAKRIFASDDSNTLNYKTLTPPPQEPNPLYSKRQRHAIDSLHSRDHALVPHNLQEVSSNNALVDLTGPQFGLSYTASVATHGFNTDWENHNEIPLCSTFPDNFYPLVEDSDFGTEGYNWENSLQMQPAWNENFPLQSSPTVSSGNLRFGTGVGLNTFERKHSEIPIMYEHNDSGANQVNRCRHSFHKLWTIQ
jgi:hypothetical protein